MAISGWRQSLSLNETVTGECPFVAKAIEDMDPEPEVLEQTEVYAV